MYGNVPWQWPAASGVVSTDYDLIGDMSQGAAGSGGDRATEKGDDDSGISGGSFNSGGESVICIFVPQYDTRVS